MENEIQDFNRHLLRSMNRNKGDRTEMKTETEVKPTPTPWTFGESNEEGLSSIRDGKTAHRIAQVMGEDNAAFIVRAVNAHEKLLETIRWVAQTIHQAYHEKGTFMDCGKNTCDAAKQALAHAEGKE